MHVLGVFCRDHKGMDGLEGKACRCSGDVCLWIAAVVDLVVIDITAEALQKGRKVKRLVLLLTDDDAREREMAVTDVYGISLVVR